MCFINYFYRYTQLLNIAEEIFSGEVIGVDLKVPEKGNCDVLQAGKI